MKYSEIFYTLQGEGKLIGVPSVFFRLSACNLRCAWCDTPYTSWNAETKEISVADAFVALTKFAVKHIVITGGEPFLQKKELTELCALLSANGHHITIETNATVFLPIQADLISMSPKLSSSTPLNDTRWHEIHNKERIKPEVIQAFLDNYECQTKFVISNTEDFQEMQVLEQQLAIPRDSIVLMPQGIELEDIKQREQWLTEICKEFAYRYSPRLHINIWGNKRGT